MEFVIIVILVVFDLIKFMLANLSSSSVILLWNYLNSSPSDMQKKLFSTPTSLRGVQHLSSLFFRPCLLNDKSYCDQPIWQNPTTSKDVCGKSHRFCWLSGSSDRHQAAWVVCCCLPQMYRFLSGPGRRDSCTFASSSNQLTSWLPASASGRYRAELWI